MLIFTCVFYLLVYNWHNGKMVTCMKVYKVGGWCRDTLLGLTPKDTDYLVVGSTPEEMLSLGFVSVGEAFPVFLHPQTGDEYALARVERKVGVGYKGFTCNYSPDTLVDKNLLKKFIEIGFNEDDDYDVRDLVEAFRHIIQSK